MKEQIIQLIKEYNTIIIHRHVRPDPDAYGSQAGLGEMIKHSFPNKTVLLAGEEDPSLNYLSRLDNINDDQYKGSLVIVCDTANEERVCDQRYKQGDKLIKIDHHPNREPYGDIVLVDTDASSTSEMIYELYQAGKQEGLTLNQKSARLLYAGIVGDTGRFLFPSTTGRTFEVASDLTKYDFDRTELYDNMYQIPLRIAKFKGELLANIEPRESGLAVFKIDRNLLEEYNLTADDTHAFVGIAGDIKDVLAWVFFVEEEDTIRVRLRSKGPVINDVAFQYNGGGHPMASGAKVSSWDEADRLVQDLNQVCLKYNQTSQA
ncbi:DHH family phosphoesterase [Tenuibacillus multivorans]|uniref:Phosphoesterase RecJ domain-containing protein n=1 Tax=Tenuibacillus multivorans TaxID=237069 RepID=A0A1G9ZTV8_9BACI|nr:bifunctional oligoribonuclease/PAP phosphatase NrnA [Tenuibacillus multivorans]GEL76862.1 bifunctional oligoribonuclease and PAP phosphatase NrnA [Tenuibacillus multivorans]SDN25072.1 phosphoesterase RecJ domain-containing protein [Tenuibacillus multivorans]